MSNTTTRLRDKPERQPLHEQQRDILSVPPKPGFHRCWVNDVERNVDAYLRAGYTIVEEDVKTKEENVDYPDNGVGSGIRKYVGGGITAVLMEINQEWFDEDQAAIDAKNDERERQIFRGSGVEGIDGNTKVEERTGVRPRRKKS